MSLLAIQKEKEIQSSSRFYSKDNLDILLKAIKELGGACTRRQLEEFLRKEENARFARPHGRSWFLGGRLQHDMAGAVKLGRLMIDKLHGTPVYFVSESEWKFPEDA